MPTIELGYGRVSIKFDYDSARFDILGPEESPRLPLSDSEIGDALDAPIGSSPLEDLIASGDKVLIVTSDATRATGSAQIRSEEHTSELQSHSDLVCRLLLVK